MNTIKSLAAKASAGVTLSLVTASTALGQRGMDPSVPNPVRGTSLADVLFDVVNALLLFAGAVAVLFLIIGGFRYVVSTGSPEQVEGAKKTILYAILGLIIIFVAYVLVQLIQDYLGVTGRYNLDR